MKKQYTINYPKDSGFASSVIDFYSGAPCVDKIFFGERNSEGGRLFVTDTNISSLPSMKDFISCFEPADFSELTENAKLCTRKNSADLLLVMGSGEAYKTLDSVMNIVKSALSRNFTRTCTFVAIGGGVICDMTAFAAAIFKRGVDVEFVPTTLLAMVDASLGGKTGCDYEGYKNMIGTFWPAKKLHVWSDFVLSLPEDEYISGLGEALKTALLFSGDLWKLMDDKRQLVLERNSEVLEKIISECVKAKAKIVEEDLREKGRRAFLNLGHTFGHALEAAAGLGKITHGGAVAWGMGRAYDLSANLGICTSETAEEVKKVLADYGYDMNPVPAVLEGKKDASKLIEAMYKDKKNLESTQIRFILQKGICQTEIIKVAERDIAEVLR